MKKSFAILIIICILFQGGAFLSFAQEGASTEEINELNQEIEQKKQSIDQLNRQIETYRQKIEQKQSEEISLYNEIDLIENRIAKNQLDIEAVEAEIDLTQSEVAIIEHEIHALERKMEEQREYVADILQEIQIQDQSLPIELIFGTDSLSDIFTSLDQLETVSDDLQNALDAAKKSKETLLVSRQAEEEKKSQLEQLSSTLAQEKRQLESSIGAKETLLVRTQQSESEFQRLLQTLRQEQTYVNQQISILQQEIEGKLDASDDLGDSSILSWPVNPTLRGISAYFHDTSYPFRHLFEHSGLDLPAPTGTPVLSAAPGYVAWARTGTLYGNYVMIIHTDGVATLYAHLSRISVSADQFVARGDQIGAVGSTGLSTGPHLHFEVRKNGIPTNPLDYLISY